jgi:hypothetical protein
LLAYVAQCCRRISYLIRAQLKVVPLIRDNGTCFHGEHATLGSNNQRKHPVLKSDIVGSLEVFINGNLFSSTSCSISQGKGCVLCILAIPEPFWLVLAPGEALDVIELVICKSISLSSK